MIDFALAEDFWVCVFLAAVIHSPHDEVQRSWQRVFSQNMRLATGREQRLAEMRVCVCVCVNRWRQVWVKEAGVCGVYPGGVRLQGSQVVLQGQTAAVVQHGLHPSQVSLHQLLLLAGCLLLQGLHHGLEVLQTKKKS